MGNPFGTILEGVRYQHLNSWYHLLPLLDEDSPYEYGFIEHPSAESADDITLHPKTDSGAPAKFIQIKWHVDHCNSYSIDSLVEVEKSGTRSLLQKLFDSWKELHANGSVEIWLVSNWSSARDLGRFIRSREYKLVEEFLTAGPRSAAGKARTKWKDHLGATDEELVAFCKDLRLRLGFRSICDLQDMVDDRMGNYGLQKGENAQAIAIDELATRIETGGELKRITKDVLLEIIERRNLRAILPEEPKVCLWIHGWAKLTYDHPPTIEINWTKHFDRDSRRIPDQNVWDTTLFPALARARKRFETVHGGSYIDFRGKLPLTAVLAVGAKFLEVAGYGFRIEQPTEGQINLWRSNAGISDRCFKVKEAGGEQGENLLIAFCITNPGWKDVEPFFKQHSDLFNAVVYAEPDNGTGAGTVRSDPDVVALAIDAKKLIREYRQKYHASRTHLIVYGPAAFCLFLGQKLNALGTIVTYERSEDGGYQPSVTLQTG